MLREVEGRLEIHRRPRLCGSWITRPALVAVADTDLPVLTAEQVRDALEATRR